MPEGYHPNVAAPGGSINFLWMMAANREREDRQHGVVNVQPDFAAIPSGLDKGRAGSMMHGMDVRLKLEAPSEELRAEFLDMAAGLRRPRRVAVRACFSGFRGLSSATRLGRA